MARYGLRVRGNDNVMQIDDRHANLIMSDVQNCQFVEVDTEYSPERTDYQAITVPDKPHVIAIQPLTDNVSFVAQPTTNRPDGRYRYLVRPLSNQVSKCRVFVFSGFDADAKERYGMRISGLSGPAFISSLPYMRVVGFDHMDARDEAMEINPPDASRDYALAILSFSCYTLPVRYQRNEQTVEIRASRCRGVFRNPDAFGVGAGVVSLIGSGNDLDTAYFESTDVMLIDVTDLY